MAPQAAGEEQGEDVEVVPAHPDNNPILEQQQHAVELRTIEALSELQPLRARISRLLGPAGPRRVVAAGDFGRRCLAFVETELSIFEACLATLSPQHYLLDDKAKEWLQRYLDYDVPHWAHGVLREVEPSRHTLLRIAAQYFHRKKSPDSLLFKAAAFYYICECTRDLTSSDYLGLTPQRAEAGALLPLVGIDRPAKKILRWFTTHQDQGKKMGRILRIMCIVGPVGIGKTALAMEIRNRLNHETTTGGRYHFQCNVMAQASRGTDTSNMLLLQDVLLQLSDPAAPVILPSDRSQPTTMELLVRLVSERLQDKRYLIIIDDIREASDWEEIKQAFPNNNLGSRILITTRVTSIAEACCSGSYYGLVHKMKPLQQGVDEEEERQRLAIYCPGQVPRLPERLEQSLSSAFNNGHSSNDLMSLLLYMSMFPYGYKFDKDRLIQKWISEGLVLWSNFTVVKEKAESFFWLLVDRNVITCVAANCKHNNTVDDEAEACQWHVNHLMHQFLASKSAEMGFVFTTTTLNNLSAAGSGNETSSSNSRMPRRLALHHPDPLLPSLLANMDLSQTRSLAVSGAVSQIPLDKFLNLVVLDLEGWESLNDEDLRQVCKSRMFFLRFLSVRNTRVSKLPHEIKELRILKTLDISYTQIRELPPELFDLASLERLDLRGTRISHLPKQIAGLRNSLCYLLLGAEGTMNSVETATRLPHDVNRLYDLETLATVDLTEHPASFVRDLGYLRKLKVFAITWSFHNSTDIECCKALLFSIVLRRKLKSLTIHCGLGCSMEFLGSLSKSDAPWKLEKFKVTAGRFASVPRWIDGLQCLAFVQITVCNKQSIDDLKILGALPKLQCLILGLDFIPGQDIFIRDEGFRMLQRFSVDCPMPWLTFGTRAMPNVTYLQLKLCATPASQICVPSGIGNLRRLTDVALCYNAQYINSRSIKLTVEAVRKQVAEHCNPIDLFINGIEEEDVQ